MRAADCHWVRGSLSVALAGEEVLGIGCLGECRPLSMSHGRRKTVQREVVGISVTSQETVTCS